MEEIGLIGEVRNRSDTDGCCLVENENLVDNSLRMMCENVGGWSRSREVARESVLSAPQILNQWC